MATYRIRTRPRRMRDALRRLSESFRDRLKRFDSTHNTDKYVRVYMFLVRSHSFFFTYTKETSCLRIENNHFLFLSLSFAYILLVETRIYFYWLTEKEKKMYENEEREREKNIIDCKSTVHIGDN